MKSWLLFPDKTPRLGITTLYTIIYIINIIFIGRFFEKTLTFIEIYEFFSDQLQKNDLFMVGLHAKAFKKMDLLHLRQ